MLTENKLKQEFRSLKELNYKACEKFYKRKLAIFLLNYSEQLLSNGELLTREENLTIDALVTSLNSLPKNQLNLRHQNRLDYYDKKIGLKKDDLSADSTTGENQRAVNAIKRLEKAKQKEEERFQIISASKLEEFSFLPDDNTLELTGIQLRELDFIERALNILPKNRIKAITAPLLLKKLKYYRSFLIKKRHGEKVNDDPHYPISLAGIKKIYKNFNTVIWEDMLFDKFLDCFDLNNQPDDVPEYHDNKTICMVYVLSKIDELNKNDRSKRIKQKTALENFGINNYFQQRTNSQNANRVTGLSKNEKSIIKQIFEEQVILKKQVPFSLLQ
jgi:hypothetical protein